MISIAHLLNRTFTVFRVTTVPDGAGGQVITRVDVGTVQLRVSLPSAEERQVAAQFGADLAANAFGAPDIDVQRNDELEGDGETYQVLSTRQPSRPDYLKLELESRQSEGS